jgi:hypothetical protein
MAHGKIKISLEYSWGITKLILENTFTSFLSAFFSWLGLQLLVMSHKILVRFIHLLQFIFKKLGLSQPLESDFYVLIFR